VDDEDSWEIRELEGALVERHAESLFPGVLRISTPADDESTIETSEDFAASAARTREAMETGEPVSQAHFESGQLRAVTDILEPRNNAWFVWEVKASTGVRRQFEWDLAFQCEVLRRAGYEVAGAGVIHLNRPYVRGAALDVSALLTRADLTNAVEALREAVSADIRACLSAMAEGDAPPVTPGSRCRGNPDASDGNRPSACGHIDVLHGYCGRTLPEDWAWRLPHLSGRKAQFVDSMVEPAIRHLDPNDAALAWTDNQRRVIVASNSGCAQVDAAALRAALAGRTWPLTYLDFEFDPGMAIPRFEGTWPYLRLPFQWSARIQIQRDAPLGAPLDFVHVNTSDPRHEFLTSLVQALPQSGSIVVYSKTAEETVLTQLGATLGGNARVQAKQLKTRLFDALRVVRAGYYHPSQRDSYSIKKVAPALLGRGYDDLAIQDGMAAVVAWRHTLSPDCLESERDRIRRDLLAYCGRDAELMHDILCELERLATATDL